MQCQCGVCGGPNGPECPECATCCTGQINVGDDEPTTKPKDYALIIDPKEIRTKLLNRCCELREQQSTAKEDDPDVVKAWFSGWRNGWEKAIEQFEHDIIELLPIK